MSKVVGMGETVLDIIFDSNNQPVKAQPGGSVFNGLISVARAGVEASFISEVGNDRVGDIIRSFLRSNGVNDAGVVVYPGTKSPLALAFLDANRNAQYQFYKDYASQRVDFVLPQMSDGDVLLFGSFFALNPAIRSQVVRGIGEARKMGALVYYDVNFRATHSHEVNDLMPAIIENFRMAHVVKGSDEDMFNMFGTSNRREAYDRYIRPHCDYFICTEGGNGAYLLHGDDELFLPVDRIEPLSTIGAGDNFNAGVACGLLALGVGASQIGGPAFDSLLLKAMQTGADFAREVCLSYDNYIAPR